MNTKTCSHCCKSKPITEFYKHVEMKDGHRNICKTCSISESLAYNQSEKGKTVKGLYRTSIGGRRKHGIDTAKFKALHPEVPAAHNAVNNAVRDGKLKRPSCCSICGAKCLPHGHHESYANDDWLKVIWVCVNCHIDIHGRV